MPDTPAATPPATVRRDPGGFTLTGLTPGVPYLLRAAYSRYFRTETGVMLPEANGLMVVIPDAATMRLAFAPLGMLFWVLVGIAVITLVTCGIRIATLPPRAAP